MGEIFIRKRGRKGEREKGRRGEKEKGHSRQTKELTIVK